MVGGAGVIVGCGRRGWYHEQNGFLVPRSACNIMNHSSGSCRVDAEKHGRPYAITDDIFTKTNYTCTVSIPF